MSISEPNELYWDSTYAIAISLLLHFPDRTPERVGLQELAELIQQLPGFSDDPELVNDRILQDIFIVWYEEALNA